MSGGASQRATHPSVDAVYIAVCAADARLARICIASVRRYYPDVPIRLLPGGKISSSLVRDSKRHWDVDVAKIPSGDYGWGFVKLEALFGPAGERFLVLDSDTVITGPVLDLWKKGEAPFLVNAETPSETEMQVHYDWEKARQIDGDCPPPQFIFNSGQWFGTAGLLTRDDFNSGLEWTMPRRLRHPDVFKNGEQGILNYVLNRKAAFHGLRVDRLPLMLWPGRGMGGLNAQAVSCGAAPSCVVHWAGMRKARHRDMVGCDLLDLFEQQYYRPLPAGAVRIIFDRCLDVVLNQWLRFFRLWVRLFFRYKIMPLFRTNALPARRKDATHP